MTELKFSGAQFPQHCCGNWACCNNRDPPLKSQNLSIVPLRMSQLVGHTEVHTHNILFVIHYILLRKWQARTWAVSRWSLGGARRSDSCSPWAWPGPSGTSSLFTGKQSQDQNSRSRINPRTHLKIIITEN